MEQINKTAQIIKTGSQDRDKGKQKFMSLICGTEDVSVTMMCFIIMMDKDVIETYILT